MSTAKFVEVHVDDVVRLRKTHPCGGTDWSVTRLGADILKNTLSMTGSRAVPETRP